MTAKPGRKNIFWFCKNIMKQVSRRIWSKKKVRGPVMTVYEPLSHNFLNVSSVTTISIIELSQFLNR